MIIFLSGAIFFGAAYAYLDYNINVDTADVDQKDYTVPYVRTPESCGIAFVFPDDSATLVYLDFEEENIRLLSIDSFDPSRPEYYGYTADYTVQTSYELIEGIIGRVEDINRQILLQIFDKISKNSFSKDDFVYIIENSESDLSFVDCIDWLDYLKSMSGRVNFVN